MAFRVCVEFELCNVRRMQNTRSAVHSIATTISFEQIYSADRKSSYLFINFNVLFITSLKQK